MFIGVSASPAASWTSKAYAGQAEAVSMPRSVGSETDFVAQVRASFRKQGIMKLLGARITRVEKGLVEISTRNRPEISQQDGFVHAGALASLADSAGGYAVLSLLPRGSRVLSVEFKINFTAPAIGIMVRGRGRVKKLGRTIAVCEIEVESMHHSKWRTCAWGSQTVYCIKEPMAPQTGLHV